MARKESPELDVARECSSSFALPLYPLEREGLLGRRRTPGRSEMNPREARPSAFDLFDNLGLEPDPSQGDIYAFSGQSGAPDPPLRAPQLPHVGGLPSVTATIQDEPMYPILVPTPMHRASMLPDRNDSVGLSSRSFVPRSPFVRGTPAIRDLDVTPPALRHGPDGKARSAPSSPRLGTGRRKFGRSRASDGYEEEEEEEDDDNGDGDESDARVALGQNEKDRGAWGDPACAQQRRDVQRHVHNAINALIHPKTTRKEMLHCAVAIESTVDVLFDALEQLLGETAAQLDSERRLRQLTEDHIARLEARLFGSSSSPRPGGQDTEDVVPAAAGTVGLRSGYEASTEETTSRSAGEPSSSRSPCVATSECDDDMEDVTSDSEDSSSNDDDLPLETVSTASVEPGNPTGSASSGQLLAVVEEGEEEAAYYQRLSQLEWNQRLAVSGREKSSTRRKNRLRSFSWSSLVHGGIRRKSTAEAITQLSALEVSPARTNVCVRCRAMAMLATEEALQEEQLGRLDTGTRREQEQAQAEQLRRKLVESQLECINLQRLYEASLDSRAELFFETERLRADRDTHTRRLMDEAADILSMERGLFQDLEDVKRLLTQKLDKVLSVFEDLGSTVPLQGRPTASLITPLSTSRSSVNLRGPRSGGLPSANRAPRWPVGNHPAPKPGSAFDNVKIRFTME